MQPIVVRYRRADFEWWIAECTEFGIRVDTATSHEMFAQVEAALRQAHGVVACIGRDRVR